MPAQLQRRLSVFVALLALIAGAVVGAGSVVLKEVPECATVVGVPAKVVGWCSGPAAALAMDQSLPEPDYSI